MRFIVRSIACDPDQIWGYTLFGSWFSSKNGASDIKIFFGENHTIFEGIQAPAKGIGVLQGINISIWYPYSNI